MSEYVSIKTRELDIWTFRNYVEIRIAELFFNQSDLTITPNVRYEIDDEDEIPHTQYEFITTVKKAKERFDALGYSLNNFELEFDKNKFKWIAYDEFLSHLNIALDDYDEVKIKRINKYITFEKWKNSIKKFVEYGLEHNIYRPDKNKIKINTEGDKVIYYSFNENNFFGMNWEDEEAIKYTLRLILEFCSEYDEIILDVSALIGWSYNSINEIELGGSIEKNIVLVEGSSDKSIIEFGLNYIYPHLSNLFYFMDFDLGNKTREGSCEILSKNIITFIASKLKAKFIAVYDNDTAGVFAKEKILDDIRSIPNNFRILNYPNINRARNYPTIGTNKKIIFDNVNNRACSIEMYLPKKLIVDNNGDYLPIQWASLMTRKLKHNTLSDYQGVIIDKDKIKSKYVELSNQIKNNVELFDIDEWNELKQIVDVIVFAFKK